MPGFDRTGPRGMGSMTGGARGMCNPAGAGEQTFYGYGRGMAFRRGGRGGFGRFRGAGWGFGARFVQPGYPYSTSSELEMLKTEADSAKAALDAVNQRISELEKQSE
ncbi:MAG: DUF5320 domain-containing protein [Desulfarculaceae bacterium]|nr:DUF5320 domain-containing protein [Desulfarculaceae bacterium]